MRSIRPLPSLELLNDLFELDAERGLLFRKRRSGSRGNPGSPVGFPGTGGYLLVGIGPHKYRVHRIIFYLYYGYDPVIGLDHENCNRADNRPTNLRVATSMQNAGNMPPPVNNKSGYKGVSWQRNCGKWQAHLKVAKKTTYLGMYDTPEDAARAYAAAARQHFGEFAQVADV